MTAGKYPLILEQGSTFSRVLTWKDVNGTAINLSGYVARMQIRQTVDAAISLLELTTENGRITLGGPNGTITLFIAAADTLALSQTSAVYDLELLSSSGVVTRLLEGSVTISQEVTR
jgi:hypothetical protein